jgi:pimeloyl-ACP methyl ester carboxylesterase
MSGVPQSAPSSALKSSPRQTTANGGTSNSEKHIRIAPNTYLPINTSPTHVHNNNNGVTAYDKLPLNPIPSTPRSKFSDMRTSYHTHFASIELYNANNTPHIAPTNKNLLVFYVTGNPGGLEFYVEFANDLLAMLSTTTIIQDRYDNLYLHTTAHSNHHLLRESESPVDTAFQSCGLQDQIDHQYQHLLESISKHSTPESHDDLDIMLCGHSIGCYIFLDIVDKHPEIKARVKYTILLMPFIGWQRLPPLHRFQLTVFTWLKPLVTAFLRNFVHLYWSLSPSMRGWAGRNVLTNNSLNEYFAEIVANRFFTSRMAMNFLSMGADEIRDVAIHEERMFNVITSLSAVSNVMCVYTDNDKWAPEADMHHLLLTQSKKGQTENTVMCVQHIPGITHSFTVSEAGRRLVISSLYDVLSVTRSARKGYTPRVTNSDVSPHMTPRMSPSNVQASAFKSTLTGKKSTKKQKKQTVPILLLSATPLLGFLVRHALYVVNS